MQHLLILFPSGTKLTRRWTCRHRARKWRTRRGCKKSRSTSWWRKFGLKMGTSSWKHLPTTVQLVSSNLFPLISINLDQSIMYSSLIFSFKNSILLNLLFSSRPLNWMEFLPFAAEAAATFFNSNPRLVLDIASPIIEDTAATVSRALVARALNVLTKQELLP